VDSCRQPDAQAHYDHAGNRTHAANRPDAIAEQLDPAAQQEEIQRRMHIVGGVKPQVDRRILGEQQARAFIAPDR